MLRPLSLGLDTIMAITIQTPDSRCEYSKHATRLFAQTWAAPEFSIEAGLLIGTQIYHISMCRTLKVIVAFSVHNKYQRDSPNFYSVLFRIFVFHPPKRYFSQSFDLI